MRAIIGQDIVRGLRSVGLESGDIVMVHASLRSMGYVIGGAQTVLEALREVVGPHGTLVMPTQSWKNLDPETGVHWDCDPQDFDLIRANWPAYDPKLTPTNTMGAVAELFRQLPGSLRTLHPARSICANGPHAEYITSVHSLSDIFGETSPLARLYALDAKVLLIGVGYDKNTSLHLADARAVWPGKHTCTEHSAIMENGKRVWKAYETLYVDGEDFTELGAAFEQAHPVAVSTVGTAELRLMHQRTLVDFATQWITANRH